jgi:hypothetical protein
MQKFRKIIIGTAVFTPMFAFAATTATSIIGNVSKIVDQIIPILVAAALAYFIWGVLSFIMAKEDADKKTAARNTIIYGVIGLFAITAVWGLVGVVSSTFDIDTGGATGVIPTIGK